MVSGNVFNCASECQNFIRWTDTNNRTLGTDRTLTIANNTVNMVGTSGLNEPGFVAEGASQASDKLDAVVTGNKVTMAAGSPKWNLNADWKTGTSSFVAGSNCYAPVGGNMYEWLTVPASFASWSGTAPTESGSSEAASCP
jgi:hypothetical protein